VSTPVVQAPSAFGLAGVRTSRPVSVATVSRWAEEIAFLVGHNVHKAGEAYCPLRGTGRTVLEGLAFSTHVPYSRSAGAQVIRVGVELHASNELGDSQTVTVTLPTGAVWIDAAGLDGTVTHYNPPNGRTTPREIVGWADVSSVTSGLTTVVTVATAPSAKGAGIRRVVVHEAPLSSLAVSSAEPGWDAAAARSTRPVIDGGASSPRGTQRLFHCLDAARATWRQHFALSGVESADGAAHGATPHWSRELATYGVIDWGADGLVNDPTWYLQLRDLYAGVASPWAFRVRYRTSNAVDCGIKVFHQGGSITTGTWTGVGAEGSTTLTLPSTSGAWAWATATAASLPVDGTDGLCRLRFEAKGPGAAELLSIACIDLRENEV
jgi:hypothetical protein